MYSMKKGGSSKSSKQQVAMAMKVANKTPKKMKMGGEDGPGPKKKKTINPETSINVPTRYGMSQIDTAGYSKRKFAYPFETKNDKGEVVNKGMLRRKGVTEVLEQNKLGGSISKKPKMKMGGSCGTPKRLTKKK